MIVLLRLDIICKKITAPTVLYDFGRRTDSMDSSDLVRPGGLEVPLAKSYRSNY